jgi:hypothetical protein
MSGKISELTRAQKETLAHRHLAGESYSDLEGYNDLTHGQIVALFKRQDMLDIVAAARGYFEQSAARAYLRMHMLSPRAADVQDELLWSQSEQMKFNASKFVLDKILPQKSSISAEIDVRHHVDGSVLVQAMDTAKEVLTLLKDRKDSGNGIDRFLLRGTEGIETAEPSDPGPPALAELGGPDGSGPAQSDDKADGKPEPPLDS